MILYFFFIISENFSICLLIFVIGYLIGYYSYKYVTAKSSIIEIHQLQIVIIKFYYSQVIIKKNWFAISTTKRRQFKRWFLCWKWFIQWSKFFGKNKRKNWGANYIFKLWLFYWEKDHVSFCWVVSYANQRNCKNFSYTIEGIFAKQEILYKIGWCSSYTMGKRYDRTYLVEFAWLNISPNQKIYVKEGQKQEIVPFSLCSCFSCNQMLKCLS